VEHIAADDDSTGGAARGAAHDAAPSVRRSAVLGVRLAQRQNPRQTAALIGWY
jgi:hypothetical protein